MTQVIDIDIVDKKEIKEDVKEVEIDKDKVDEVKEPKVKKVYKTFKQRCDEDPAFYQKTKDKLKELTHCDICNCDVAKSALSKHRTTTKHLKNKQKYDKEEADKEKISYNKGLIDMLKDLTAQVQALQKPKQTKPSSAKNAEKARAKMKIMQEDKMIRLNKEKEEREKEKQEKDEVFEDLNNNN